MKPILGLEHQPPLLLYIYTTHPIMYQPLHHPEILPMQRLIVLTTPLNVGSGLHVYYYPRSCFKYHPTAGHSFGPALCNSHSKRWYSVNTEDDAPEVDERKKV